MDIQFSGAIDFAPLFNGMNQMTGMQRRQMNNNHQAKMLEDQNKIMSEINASTQLSVMEHFALRGIGQNVNIIV